MFHAGLLRSPDNAGGDPDRAVADWPQRMRELAESARDARLKAYYAAGSVSADTPLSAAPLMAMDVETTGLDPQRDSIISIGLVPMNLQLIRASQSRHWLLKPRTELGAESVTIHGITDSTIGRAPDLIEILPELLECIAGQVLIVHCRDIERQFLAEALLTRIGEGISFPVIDTMELEARLYRHQPVGMLQRMFARPAPQLSIRLADSRRRYGLPRYRPHHAMTDALSSAELLQAQVAHRFSPATPIGELWK